MPPTTFATTPQARAKRPRQTPRRAPMTNAPTGKPMKYPADGAVSTPRPPRPPASSGSPRTTSTQNTRTARAPRRAPSREPASMTPRVCAVIGTALPKRLSWPGSPRTAISAANVATSARSRAGRRPVMRHRLRAGRGAARPRIRREAAASGVGEGVAAVDVAAGVAGAEPGAALLRRAVGEALRVHPPLGLLLDPVVAHGRRRLLGLLDVVRGEVDAVLLRLVGELGPDARVAVRLQLQRHGIAVRQRGIALLRGADLGLGAQQRLQVVPVLVGEDVRLRELALRTELVLQLLQEPEVEVDPLVLGAVEGAGRRAGLATARGRRAREEHQAGRVVRRAAAGELLLPHRVGDVVDLDQPAVGVLVQGARAVAALLQLLVRLARRPGAHLGAVDRQLEASRAAAAAAPEDAEQQVDDQAHDAGAPADREPTAPEAAEPTSAAAVVDTTDAHPAVVELDRHGRRLTPVDGARRRA